MERGTARRVIIVFAGRFPGEKAAGLFADLEARSFASIGHEVVVVAPRRFRRGSNRQRSYALRYLPTIDVVSIPLLRAIAGYLNTLVFGMSAFLWYLFSRRAGDVVISNEALPLLLISFISKTTVYELHDFPERSFRLYRALFRRVHRILATNEWKKAELTRRFGVSSAKIIMERNAVDTAAFGRIEQREAREQLGIPTESPVVVYTGQLYEWKGADTLARAATLLPLALFVFVGGVGEDLTRFKRSWAGQRNVRIEGQVPHERVPLWQAAADVLALPNSARAALSERYTSPMKLFEYMAAKRPIVASDIPAIREVLDDSCVFFAAADDSDSFAAAIRAALEKSTDASERVKRAGERVANYTWQKHAERILSGL